MTTLTPRYILTHPGGAHKDEFLACCILLARHPVAIVRREPSEAELADPSVTVVDVGGRHQPELANFDHHQFPRSHAPLCSLSLVLQHYGLYDDAREFCDWLETAEWFDSRGPVATAAWLGTSREVLTRLNSPIDLGLLRRFGQQEHLFSGEPLWEIMRVIGSELLDYIVHLRQRLTQLGQWTELWTLPLAHDGSTAEVLYLPRREELSEDPSLGIDRFVENRGWYGRVVATVVPDRRGPGYGLCRLRDHPRLDFRRIAHHPQVRFAHASGFLAKTDSADPAILRSLLLAADTQGNGPS